MQDKTRNLSKRYERIMRKASFKQIEEASKWYVNANQIAQQVAAAGGIDVEQASAVISALSPRMHWLTNVKKSFDLVQGRKVLGIKRNIKTAILAKEIGVAALRGPKTIEFAKAICGDEDAVVIDTWMCKAVGLKRDSPTPAQYRIMSRAVSNAARRMGLTPRTAQALIWIITRGSS